MKMKMTKKLSIYYSFLSLAVLAQMLLTVFTLSQNIGYGQKISFLENKRLSLEAEKNQLQTARAKNLAIGKLAELENSDYVAIADVLVLTRDSASLALK